MFRSTPIRTCHFVATLFSAGCGANVCEGTYTIESASDRSEIGSCSEITGDLNVPRGLAFVSAPELQVLGGQLNMNSATLEEIHFPRLRAIGGDLDIVSCHSLTSLEGLAGLRSIGRDIDMNDSELIASLIGLEDLESVGRDLLIRSNPGLSDVSALASVTVARNLEITSNPALATCEAEQLAQRVVVGGETTISGNHVDGVCE